MLPNLQLENQLCVSEGPQSNYSIAFWGEDGRHRTVYQPIKGSFITLNAVTYILIKHWSIAGQ